MSNQPIVVRVTEQHIRDSEPGNCFRCAAAIAVAAATGDDQSNVYEKFGLTYIETHSLHVIAPVEVRRLVRALDDLDRYTKGPRKGRAKLPKKLPDELAPVEFELPAWDDPEWQEQCCQCEELFAPANLDGDGFCSECQEEQE
jgi:hypothetical protein